MARAAGESFGDLLKRFRQRTGLTQEELAERAEMSPRGLIYLERGARRPQAGTVRRLAAALALDDRGRAALLAAARGLPDEAASRPSAAPGVGDGSGGLGVPLTSLIGRECEVAVATGLLQRPGARLLTVTGPGGVGKTRLALRVATDLAPEYAHGMATVALASVHDPGLVVFAIAQGFDIREDGGRSLWRGLVDALFDKELLLLLDNFEQVLDAAADVARLLAACPRLRVLVTSRAALRVNGEQELPLAPLALPDAAGMADIDALGLVPSVALFVERARAVRPSFTLTTADAPAVAEICLRLDGLPLAIELAAARVAVLSPPAMLARLEPRLPLLTRGGPDRPSRQRTMADAIAWSYDLLTPDEQRAFRRLSVFVGGFDLGAGSWVMDDGGADAPASSPMTHDLSPMTLDLVASLVDKSLVRRVEGVDGEPRFTMLETIREYGLEQLEASGEAMAVRRRHAEYFAMLAEWFDREVLGPEQLTWLARLEIDFDNLRAALAWSLTGDDLCTPAPVEPGARLLGALLWFWYIHCHVTEGVRWAEAALAKGNRLPPRERAGVLFVLASLTAVQGDYRRMESLTEEALSLFREMDDRWKVAFGTGALGLAPLAQGDYERAESRFAACLALARALGDDWLIGWSLGTLGRVALFEGDHERAIELLEESLELQQQVGDPFALSLSLSNLGQTLMASGDWERAAAISERHLALSRDVGFTRGVATALHDAGWLACRQGQYERAAGYFRESLAIAYEVGERRSIAAGLEGVAGALARHAARSSLGDPTAADLARTVRLFGAAAALRQRISVPLTPAEQAACDEDVALARAGLDDATFEAAWAEGARLQLEAVIREALANDR